MPDTHAGTHGRSGATRSQIPSGEERRPVSILIKFFCQRGLLKLGLYISFYRLVLCVKNSPSVGFFEVETKQTMPSLAPARTRVHPLCTRHAWLRGEDRVALPSLHSKQRIKHVVLNRPFFWQENIQTPRLVETGLTGFRVGRVLTHARTPT